MLGYVAETLLEHSDERVSVTELTGEELLVDVRSSEEHAVGAIPSRNIPVDELRDRVDELDGSPVVVYCQVGVRGHTAARLLRNLGIPARNLDGGWRTYSVTDAVTTLMGGMRVPLGV